MSEDVGSPRSADIVVNRDGRVLIPKQVRQELGIVAGAVLVVSVEDGRVVLESRAQLMDRIRREVAAARTDDPHTSVVDELLAERRAEDATESRDAR